VAGCKPAINKTKSITYVVSRSGSKDQNVRRGVPPAVVEWRGRQRPELAASAGTAARWASAYAAGAAGVWRMLRTASSCRGGTTPKESYANCSLYKLGRGSTAVYSVRMPKSNRLS